MTCGRAFSAYNSLFANRFLCFISPMQHTASAHLPKQAFSLVELSIVLVILGLLTGGILAGQSLIRAAELRSVSTEYQKYVGAKQTFRDKYFAIPGDMANATSFWGAAHATPATCATTASTSALTCNGDGNGQVHVAASSNVYEAYRFWQHLANAGLLEGQFDGITHGATNYSSTAANSPKSKLGNSFWFTWYWGSLSGQPTFFDGQYDNSFLIGGLMTDNPPYNASFKPEETWNIDTKMDDGKPATGNVVSWWSGGCTDAASSATITANYALTSTSNSCVLVFRRQ
ncbi:MAG: hypothetical protein C0436_02910 [Alphaproteobacteria bacterium]|nr:hypothetical protein [Alphaproteobacteria bacterium]